jgi:hypothetical protein
MLRPQAYFLASEYRTCNCLPPKKLNPPSVLRWTTIRKLLQPLPLRGAVGCDLCITIIGNGVVRLCFGSFDGGSLVGMAVVGGAIGCNVGLVVIGDGVVRFGVGLLVGGSLVGGEVF